MPSAADMRVEAAVTEAPVRRTRGQVVAQSARVLLLFRLLCALPVVLQWRSGESGPTAVELVIVFTTLLGTSALLLAWNRLAEIIMRHPVIVGIDILISLACLAVSSTNSAFVAYLLTSAYLAGLMFDRPANWLLGGLAGAGYAAIFMATTPPADIVPAMPWGGAVLGAIIVAVLAGHLLRGLQRQVDFAVWRAQQEAHEAALGEERTRLARELHDSLTKTLIGIELQATSLAMVHPEVGDRAGQIGSVAREAVAESRRILSDLRQAQNSRLEESVRQTAAEIGALHGMPIRVEVDDDFPIIPPASAYAAKKILTEAALNAVKHSEGTGVDIALRSAEDAVTIVIRDDGVGFQEDQRLRASARGHFGLIGLEERAAGIGAHLTIQSRRHRGTSVTLTIPRDKGSR